MNNFLQDSINAEFRMDLIGIIWMKVKDKLNFGIVETNSRHIVLSLHW